MNAKNMNVKNNKLISNNSKGIMKPITSMKPTAIIFIVLAVILIAFTLYTFYKSISNFNNTSPYLINGITDGTVAQKFDAKKILAPSDLQYGTEFSYSFWIFIKDTNFITSANSAGPGCTVSGNFKHIFHKGSSDYKNDSNLPLLQMPGVWLYPNTNKLKINFNTYNNIVESADVGNIPLNVWVHLCITLTGKSVDIHINGNLKNRLKLSGVPKFNYGDVYSSQWGGFQGYLSRLRYFNYSIPPFMIDQMFQLGPSAQFASDITSGITQPTPKLSSNYWMTAGYPNTVGFPNYNQSAQTTA